MADKTVAEIQDRYQKVLADITLAAKSVGRQPSSVKLVVVTKGHSLETVNAVVAAGACCIGENYVEEALPKIRAFDEKALEWHMIGHVQSRKAKLVAENFPWVHSVDSYKLASRLSNFAGNLGITLSILLECNTSQEGSKFGWPAWDEQRWTDLADDLAPLIKLPHLNVCGLMTMPPYDPDPEKSRPFFQKLIKFRDFLVVRFPQTTWSELSMGMSGDYQIAVQTGATIVRVGTAIVGPRPNSR